MPRGIKPLAIASLFVFECSMVKLTLLRTDPRRVKGEADDYDPSSRFHGVADFNVLRAREVRRFCDSRGATTALRRQIRTAGRILHWVLRSDTGLRFVISTMADYERLRISAG